MPYYRPKCCSRKVSPTESSIKMGMGDPKLQMQLKKAFDKRDLARFEALLKEDINLEHKYNSIGDTILMVAALQDDTGEFAKTLLSAGADPNVGDENGVTPLHCAMIRNNDAAMDALLQDKRTDVNALDTDTANGALHYAAQASWEIEHRDRHLRCIALLMRDPRCLVNRPNQYGQTPISLAVELYYGERIRVMLAVGRGRLDVDCCRMANGRLVRDVIGKRFPELVDYLPKRRLEDIDCPDKSVQLLAALQHQDIDLFRKLLDEKLFGKPTVDPNHWYDDPYYSTCIEQACQVKGGESYVQMLLDAGADPNTKNRIYKTSLVHQATDADNYLVLEVLLGSGTLQLDAKNSCNHTAVHVAAQKQCQTVDEIERVQKCLMLLLNRKLPDDDDENEEFLGKPAIDIDSQDDFGDTALHDATHYGNRQVALTLLRRGADLTKNNLFQEPPLFFIDASTLETFLDEQLEGNGLAPQSDDYQVILKYNALIPSKVDATEMDSIKYISKTENLRHLLKHPVITSYLYLKWHCVRKLYLVNLAVYCFFVILLTIYIMLINLDHLNYSAPPGCRVDTANGTQKSANDSRSNTTRATCPHSHQYSGEESAAFFVRLPLLVFLVGIFIRELFQFLTGPRQYVSSSENILEVLLILSTGLVLCSSLLDERLVHHISAVSILLSWTELVLLTGRLPLLSLQLEMFKQVSYTFARFMAWYSLFIVAFALSFHTLFSTGIPADKDKDTFFLDPWLSILKTVVMMSGEFEASTLMFESAPVTSHVIFIIFVFMVAIVLLNLLNGLAVYDTQAIKDDAVVLGLVSMVRIVSYMENILVGISRTVLYRGCVKKFIDTRLWLFNHKLSKKQIHVFPCNGRVKFLLDLDTTGRFDDFRMHKDIVRVATDIVNNKRDTSALEEMQQLLIGYQVKLDALEWGQSVLQAQMEQVLAALTDVAQ